MALQGNQFYTLTRGPMALSDIVSCIRGIITEHPDREYKIIIGSDSAARNPVMIVSTITVLRVGNGGMYFWTRAGERHFYTLHDRMCGEAMQSILLAQEVKSLLRDVLDPDLLERIEVHLDVGLRGPTQAYVDRVVGMVRGYGFQAVIKPGSFGASCVADRHT